MQTIKISIPGGNGRMGRTLLNEILSKNNLTIGNSTCLTEDKEKGLDLGILAGKDKINKFLTDDLNAIYLDTDVIIDFTVPEASLNHAKIASENGIPIVIGTTGLNQNQFKQLKQYANEIPIVYSANFSIGISVMENLIDNAVKELGNEWDIEILETHHNKKVDSPSGTALLLGEAAANARNQKLRDVMSVSRNGLVGKRERKEIGFAVLRGGNVVGEHSIKFYNQNERLEIEHIATNRSIFAKGAIRSAEWVINSKPGLYTLKDVIKPES